MRARFRRIGFSAYTAACIAALVVMAACSHQTSPGSDAPGAASPALANVISAPPAETTAGFDGARAYKHVERLVAIGPHPAGTDGIHRAQAYITEQLKSFGCPVEEQDFHASTPIGDVAMKNILVKIPSENPNIILYASHYDTKRIDNFVGADDAGSSTGVLLEFARIACARSVRSAGMPLKSCDESTIRRPAVDVRRSVKFACHSMSRLSSARTPKTTRPAGKSSRHSKTALALRFEHTIPQPSTKASPSPRRRPGPAATVTPCTCLRTFSR